MNINLNEQVTIEKKAELELEIIKELAHVVEIGIRLGEHEYIYDEQGRQYSNPKFIKRIKERK